MSFLDGSPFVTDDDPLAVEVGTLGVASDIHGNPFALGAVLADGADEGVDRWLVLGDIVAMGPAPGEVMDQLDGVDLVAVVGGNTDRYVLTDDRPPPSLTDVAADPSLLALLVELAGSFAWTRGYLAALGHLDTLRSFRATARLAFPDGTDVLAVHASQVADEGRGIAPDVDGGELGLLFPAPSASLVFGGHTHETTDVTYDGVRYVNPGSVSNHPRPDHDARYCIVRLDGDGHRIDYRDVPYEKEQAVEAILSCGIPGADRIVRRFFTPADGG
ncbi:MAG: metallophosphoesterase family protein [Acidimicrobiales bacterium]